MLTQTSICPPHAPTSGAAWAPRRQAPRRRQLTARLITSATPPRAGRDFMPLTCSRHAAQARTPKSSRVPHLVRVPLHRACALSLPSPVAVLTAGSAVLLWGPVIKVTLLEEVSSLRRRVGLSLCENVVVCFVVIAPMRVGTGIAEPRLSQGLLYRW